MTDTNEMIRERIAKLEAREAEAVFAVLAGSDDVEHFQGGYGGPGDGTGESPKPD